MIDINKPVRKAFYDLLNGHLAISGENVPVADEQSKKTDDSNYYVILSNQTSRPDDTKQSLDRQVTITLDIVTKFSNSVTKNICDSIADQIFKLVFPSTAFPHRHNLPYQTGIQFLNISVSGDRYLSLQLSSTHHIIRRVLEFSLRVVY